MSSSREESVLRILYEDNHVIAVLKPARIPIQADDSKDLSLLELTKAYLKEKYGKPGNVYLGLVHRLDRPVRGVVVFAKTSKAASRLSESIRSREVKKIYHCIVEGSLKGEKRLTHYISKEEGTLKVLVSGEKSEGAKEAILDYGVVKEKEGKTLLEVELITGRKHQIRAQLSYMGHPIIGDKKYGSKLQFKEGEIALTAFSLEFPHPVKEEKILVQLEDDGLGF